NEEMGIPFLKNYSATTYKLHTQNWAATQDKRGVMYFANTYGILEYDGVNWNVIKVPNKSTVRSLAVGENGEVFVGATGEMGYLKPDSLGRMKYHSLMSLLDSSNNDFGEIWTVLVRGKDVFYQGRDFMYRYRDGKLKSWDLGGSLYHRSFLIDQQIYVRVVGKGLMVMKGEEFELVEGGEVLSDKRVSVMVGFGARKILIGTRKNGFFLLTKSLKSTIEPIFQNIKKQFSEAELYSGIRLSSGEFVFGTLNNGAFLVNSKGEVLQSFSIAEGLTSNKIYNLFQDKHKAIWLCTDNGISNMEIKSPISVFDSKMELNGTAYSIMRHNGVLFVATGSGTFALKNNPQKTSEFVRVENTYGQCWNLINFDVPNSNQKKLVLAMQRGVYEIKKTENGGFRAVLLKQYDATAFSVYQSEKALNKLFVGLTNGVECLEYKKNGSFETVFSVKSKLDNIRNMLLDEDNNLWTGSRFFGVSKITLDDDWKVNSVKSYGEEQGLMSAAQVELNEIDSDLIVSTPEGIVKYISESDNFQPYTRLGEKYTNSIGVLHTEVTPNGNIWIHSYEEEKNKEWIEIRFPQPNGDFSYDSLTLRRLADAEIYCIYAERNDITWVASSEGVFRFDARNHTDADIPFNALIREVSTHEDSSIFFGNHPFSYAYSDGKIKGLVQESPPLLQLPYLHNSLTFHYGAPIFGLENKTEYQHQLIGYEPMEGWSHWKTEVKTDYTNLPEGDYTFYVKAKNIYGVESSIGSYKFRISPPWFREWYAYLSYVVLSFLLVYLIVYLNSRRIRAERRKLARIVAKKTEQLRDTNHEIAEKNSELAQQTEEMAAQRDHLAESFSNIKTLSEIGQELTSSLEVEDLVARSYYHITQLMEVSIFGIGFYNEATNCIEFPSSRVFEKVEKFVQYSLDDNTRLATRCYKNEEDIFISDLEKENGNFTNSHDKMQLSSDGVESVIYLPLFSKGEKIGIITVQNVKKKAYQEYHLNLLQNMAVYIGIALDNAENFQEITLKNEEIAQANKEITASINYAQRIQNAMLPSLEDIKKELPQSFVFFKPRDIVSGDFYWFATKQDVLGNRKKIIAAVDCTGHGVPGAFMSTIGIDLLDEIVNLMGISEPDQILNYLHKLVRKALKQDETGNQDGMDMSVCVIDEKRRKLEFAGAKNPLIYIRDGKIHQVDADRCCIGGSIRGETEERKFTKHIIPLEDHPTEFYIFSDGYQDQFGGRRKRKFMSKRLRNLLFSIHKDSMEEQHYLLGSTLKRWQNTEDQVDDILVVGFRC
ncbi:MAG: serine phosphatase RsbU (regulator of sigma subunit), partial [Arenicella sp.]